VTVTTIRPNATAYAGQWRDPPSGTNLHTPTSDNSDSTLIRGFRAYPFDGYYCRIDAGSVSVGATERIMRVKLRVRYAKNGASGSYQMAKFTLADPVTGRLKDPLWIRATSTTAADADLGWWTTPPSGPEWTADIVNRINFYLINYNNIEHAALFMNVLELYADVDIRTQASIATPTVSGHTTSSQPTVAWVFSPNADFDPQRSYQVRVFTAAQVAGSGFNPASSEPVWDSGAVRSTAQERKIDLPLVNGVAYHAYVRVSAEFNGADWWTGYSGSSSFTMAYIPPPMPTLTVTPESTLPSLRSRLEVDTKLNLLTADDSSHETLIGSWAANVNCAVVRSNTLALDGTWSMRLTATAGGDMSAITVGGFAVYPVHPGKQYTYGTNFRAAATGRTCRARMQWTDALGNAIGASIAGSNVTDTTGGWTAATVTATAPNGAHGVRFIDEVVAAAAAEIHYTDKKFFHVGSSTTWTPPGLSRSDSWLTQIGRVIIEYLDWNVPQSDTRNLLNPNIANGGEAYGDTHGFARRSTKDMVELDRTGKQNQGETCIRWIVGETSGSVLDLGTAQGAFSSFTEIPTATLPGVPGRQYTLSLFARILATPTDVALAAQPIDATGAAVGSAVVGSTIELSTTMTPLTVTYTVPAGAAGVRGEFRNLEGTLTTFYLDTGQLEEGAARTAWRQSSLMITNWQTVRGALTALHGDIRDGLAAIYDRELAPGVIRMYRAWTEVDVGSGVVLRSPFSAYVPVQIDPPGVYLIKDPQQPLHDLQPYAVGDFSNHIDEDAAEYHPARPPARQLYGQRPVYVSDWISGKNGQVTVSVRDVIDWHKLQSLLFARQALLVQLPNGGQRYVKLTARNWSEPKVAFTYWKVVLDVREVDRPPVVS
jgi:hypothetical protein